MPFSQIERQLELTKKRERDAKHYLNPDGTFTAVISNGPRHFKPYTNAPWRDKVQHFCYAGAQNLVSSTDSEVGIRAYEVGSGETRRARVEFFDVVNERGVALDMFAAPRPGNLKNELCLRDGEGREWSIFHTRVGSKLLGPEVHAPRGRQTYTFPYTLLGGARPLALEGGSLVSDAFRLKKPLLIGADGRRYGVGGWRLRAQTISFSFDDRCLPSSAYPYRVDPNTTLNVAVAGDDNQVQRLSAGTEYPPTGAYELDATVNPESLVPRRDNFGTFYVCQGFVRFDTAFLSGGTVTSAALTMYHWNSYGDYTDSYSFALAWYPWSSITSADWSLTQSTSAHTGIARSSMGLLTDQTWSNLTNADGNINKSGYTGLQVGTVPDTQPTTGNNSQFASYENPTYVEPRFTLVYGFTTRLAPDAIIARTNLPNVNGVAANDATALAAIDEDPDTPDTDWLTV